jgi:tRNA/rRNA methyltransferase
MPESGELDCLRVVLVGVRNPLNLGAAARAMSNFGVLKLRVVNPYEPSILEARSAVGPAAELLADAEQFSSLAEAVADCALVVGTTAIQHRELQHPMYRLDAGASLIRQQPAGANVAVVFGPEKTGLSNQDLSYCHWLLHIPARDEHLSMNLGQAVAVTLYELVREARAIPPAQDADAATAAELDRITAALLEALDMSGYASQEAMAATEEKARRMIRRMSLNSRDGQTLLGMLRQIVWKLRH